MPPVAEHALLDFSRVKPAPPAVQAAGYVGVLAYLPVPGRDPATCASPQEIAAYVAAGLHVGAIFETTARRASAGAAAGAADAAAAEAAADAWGYPADAAIFFAVDFDAQPADYPMLRDYAAGFDGATRRPVGVYASHEVLDALVTPGQRPVRYGWQSAGWNRPGGLSANANLCQRVGHPNWPVIGSPTDTDENVLCGRDVPLMAGAVAVNDAPPAPAPAPEPAPAPAPAPAPVPADVPHSGHDATGSGLDFRAHLGDEGPRVAQLERGLNADFPAYSHLPVDGFYGRDDAAVIAEFDHREATDPATPPADRAGLAASDGEDFGPRSAAAAARFSGLI